MSIKDEVKGKIIEVNARIKQSSTDEIIDKTLSTVGTVEALNQMNATKSKKVVSAVTGSIRVLVQAVVSIRKLLGK